MLRIFFPALVLGLALTLTPINAQASKRITLQNASGVPISVALIVQTYNGWRVRGWYTVQPYSYRNVNFNDAGGEYFGYYANMRGNGKVQWAGKGNAPTIAVVGNSMNHNVRTQPYGNNPRYVKARMVRGNSVKFTYNAPQQQRRNTGWW
jgi:uncharacterized membrane protein